MHFLAAVGDARQDLGPIFGLPRRDLACRERKDEDLQEQVISIVNTATANASGLGDGIATLAKTHGFTITSDEVYVHQDFLGQDGDLTDFELELISGGNRGRNSGC